MMLFSKKMIDEGTRILEANQYKLINYRDSNLNWKLLKGYELSGSLKNCIEFANELVNQAHSVSPILHPLSMDALIGAACKLKNPHELMKYYKLAGDENVHLETSTIEKIIKYLVLNEDWKKVYDRIKKRMNDGSQDM